MLKRNPITYANVVSTLALFLVLTGGVVYAASRIGTSEIKRNAVTTQKIAPDAVTTTRIAPGAVKARRLADRSVRESKIADGAVSPDKLQFPVFFTASPTGGAAPVTSGPTPYPLDAATWTQEPGQINVVFGEADATLAYDGSGSGNCQIFFDIRLNGRQVGGGQLQTGSTTPEAVSASLGAQPEIDPVAPEEQVLTIQTGSNGDCTAGSSIDSSRFRVVNFG